MKTLITCKENCEKLLAKEAAAYHGKINSKGQSWILVDWNDTPVQDLCFAYHVLENPTKINAPTVNSLTDNLLNLFTAHIKDKQLTKPWPLLFSSSVDEKVIHRVKTVEKNWLEKLHKKMSRVAKLSSKDFPCTTESAEGFFVHFISLSEAFVSFTGKGAIQNRMHMDHQAPSRSYLKLEEAFQILESEPKDNDIVIDLGAAPGGWSYSSLKRGAAVIAIDNGPLKNPVNSHPKITHLKVDAFKYTYENPKPADWLTCDILEKPEIVLNLLHQWLSHKRCRRFVVNLKLGRTDPIFLLKNIRDPNQGIASYCSTLRVKQLYHDREEITLMGEIK